MALQFSILPGNPPPHFSNRKAYNEAYFFYKKTWERIFNRPGRPKHFSPDAFFRQSYVFQIKEGEEIVAQTLSTHFHLDHLITSEHSYFGNFKPEHIERLRCEGLLSLLSLEFSAVGRQFSPNRTEGLSYYKVIMQLGFQVARHLQVDAVFGHPRRVTGTNDVIFDAGFETYGEAMSKYGVSIDLAIGDLKKLKPYDEREMNVAYELWERREDTIGVLSNPQFKRTENEEAA